MRLLPLVAASTFLAASVAPAFADEFFIVQDKETKKCTIVKEKPTTETTILIDENGYATEVEAVEARKKVKVCVSDD